MRIGILGGTFNPVHLGHLALGRRVIEATEIEQVWLVPARWPPHKSPVDLAPAGDRLRMVELAVVAEIGLRASSIELERDAPSYSVETLRELHRRHPEHRFSWIVGADAFAEIGLWKEVASVFELAEIVVVTRAGHGLPAIPEVPGVDRAVLAACVERHVTMDPVPVSSTEIRARVRRGADLTAWVPPQVATYILDSGLYR